MREMIDLGQETILVTGARGFLGSHICPALAAAGADVRAFVRREPHRPVPGASRVIAGDLFDPGSLRDALHGASMVVHLAGRAHLSSESSMAARNELHHINVDGTAALIDQVLRSNARRFIQLSSIGSITGGSNRSISERTPAQPATAYGLSKLAADIIVSDGCSRAGIEYGILRPPMIYGPRMKGNPLRLFRLVHRGVPLPVGGIRNARTLLFVGNLVEAIKGLLLSHRLESGSYLVGDGGSVSTPDLVRIVARSLNVPAHIVSVPEFLLRWCGRLGDSLHGHGPVPTTRHIDQLLGSLVVDSTHLMRAVGFNPPFTIEEGMKMTADWYLSARP